MLIFFVVSLVAYNSAFLPGCETCHLSTSQAVAKDANKEAGGIVKITTEHSPHNDVKCSACHVGNSVAERIGFGSRMTFSMMFRVIDSKNFDSLGAYDPQCRSCHADLTKVVDNKGIRIDHDKCVGTRACASCHGTTGHQKEDGPNATYAMDECYSCHFSIASSKDCEQCHTTKDNKLRIAKTSWNVTHGVNWEQTHGMGDMKTCGTCHPQEMCGRCHGLGVPHQDNFFKLHGGMAQAKEQNCTSCHQQNFCSDCHNGYEMPHPAGFTQAHSSLASDLRDARCIKCHGVADCDGCHAAHVHPGGAIGTLGPKKVLVP